MYRHVFSSMTRSPLDLARTALKAAQKALPAYGHPKSPHKYTQHQPFACLVLKEFLHTNFRSLELTLSEWSELREGLGLRQVPHYSTFCYARGRLRITVLRSSQAGMRLL